MDHSAADGGLAFDFAREANAPRDLGTATGLANIGGFLSSGLVLLGVGLLLDWQGADNPNLYSDHTMRIAVLAQYPIWIIGLIGFSVMLPKALRNLRQRNAEISAGSWTNEY